MARFCKYSERCITCVILIRVITNFMRVLQKQKQAHAQFICHRMSWHYYGSIVIGKCKCEPQLLIGKVWISCFVLGAAPILILPMFGVPLICCFKEQG